MTNQLTYSVAREWLSGRIGNQTFSLRAWSGGGRGKKGDGAEHTLASYDVFRKESEAKGVRGGPLPSGLYVCRYVAHHPIFHECVFLEQTITALFHVDADARVRFYDRDRFYIHSRGPKGSDGCIVPENDADRHRLNLAVKHASGAVLLKVADLGMPLPAAREERTRYA